MLKLKSFEFSDDTGMNELLSNYRVAAGAHIMTSDGLIIIPYEDGEPKSDIQKTIDVKEQKNTIIEQIEIILHSQGVMKFLNDDATKRIEAAKAALSEAEANLAEAKAIKPAKGEYKEHANKLKELDAKVAEETKRLKEVEQAKVENNNQIRMNTIEIARLTLNVELFDKKIEELG